MKKLIQNILIILVLTILIMFSYACLDNKISGQSFSEFVQWMIKPFNKADKMNKRKGTNTTPNHYKAVWLSYLEFGAYLKSSKNNTEKEFRKFFQHVTEHAKEEGFNTIIVHVRPFGDALYPSKYFPWAACISGTQGKNPGYDPLKIMTEIAHKNGMRIEAWINPYRVSSGTDRKKLSKDNPAEKWMNDKATKRNVLSYDGGLYFNPSSKTVRDYIVKGVCEIVENYDVDGIHADDYFYPQFTEDNVKNSFDALDYYRDKRKGKIKKGISLAEWRRENVNRLVAAIYGAIKERKSNVTFGISPAGNLNNLRSDFEYYTDIDTWAGKEGYVDYLMPQIYWGFTNDMAPFDQVVDEWVKLMKNSPVKLYIGLQLYRMGNSEPGQSDINELQTATLIKKQLQYIKKKTEVQGVCFFSYQYLDCNNTSYSFETREFSKRRKRILYEIELHLKQWI